MVWDFDELRKKKEGGQIAILPVNRSKGRITTMILEFLEKEPASVEAISQKLKISLTTAYNTARRLEKKGKLIAFSLNGQVIFIEKKKAKEEGLLV